MPIQNIFNTTGRGNQINTASTYFASSQTSPFTNGLNQPFYRSAVSGSTRQDLVPFGLQNLSDFEGVFLRGISAVTEIYPFSGWANLQTFVVRDSKLAKFDITLPQDFGGAFYLQTNNTGAPAGNPGLYFYNNADIGIFSPKYYNGSATTAYSLQMVNNNFTGMSIDLTEKQYWSFAFYSNNNCKFLNFSGYQGGDGGIYRRNTFEFNVYSNNSLTGISFPNNSFTAYSINMSGGAKNTPSSADGILRVYKNRNLSYFDSDLPVTSTRYTADFTENKFSQWTPNFISDQPYFLNLSINVLTGISNTFQNWPLSHAKKFDNRWKTIPFQTANPNIEPTWTKSYKSYDKNKTKDDYFYLSATVTTIESTGKGVKFNVNPSNDLRGLYSVTSNSYPFGINDENRGFTGFNFICDENEDEDILKFRGKYRLGLYKFPVNTFNNYLPTIYFSAVTFIDLPNGTYTPVNGKIIYRSENSLNLDSNNFTDLRDLNGVPFNSLPEPLHKISIASNSSLTSFTPSLNSSLTQFRASSCGNLSKFFGEVSGASQITYFNVSGNKFSEWDKQFYTGITQYDMYSPRGYFDAYWYAGAATAQYNNHPFLVSYNTKKSIIGLVNQNSEYVSSTSVYYDPRWAYSRHALFSSNLLNSFDLYKLKPFDFIYLNDNSITGITQFSAHTNIKYLDLSSNRFVNSNSIINNEEVFPSSFKYLIINHNRSGGPSYLTGWTKTFSGLTSSTGFTSNIFTSHTYFDVARTNFMDLNNERLFLNFLGQYKLAYQNQNFESNFDFIVRDLCTAKTNGLYLSGGALIVSGNISYDSSQFVTANFSVDSPLTSYPSQYTGFTLSDGTPYVVSDYGYMKDWVDLLTGRTISETSGRAWEVNINNTTGPFYSTNANTSFCRFPETQKCNLLTNGTFELSLDGWQSNDEWIWYSNYGGSAQSNAPVDTFSFAISQDNILNIESLYRIVLFVNIDPSSSYPCTVRINLGTNYVDKVFPSGGGTFRIFEEITCTGGTSFSIQVKDNNVNTGNVYINKVALCEMDRGISPFEATKIYNVAGTSQLPRLTYALPVVSWSGANWCNSSKNYAGRVSNVLINGINGFNGGRWYLLKFVVNVETGGSCRKPDSNPSSPIVCNGIEGPRTASIFLGVTNNSIGWPTASQPVVPSNLVTDYRISIDGNNVSYTYNFLAKMPNTIAEPGSAIQIRTDNLNCAAGLLGPNGEIVGFYGTIELSLLELDCDQCGYVPQLNNTDETYGIRFKYNNGTSTTTGGIEFNGPTNAWTSIKLNCTSYNNNSFCTALNNTPPPISPNWKYQIYITDGTYYWIYRVTSTQEDTPGTITLNTNTTTYPIGTNSTVNPNVSSGIISLSIIY